MVAVGRDREEVAGGIRVNADGEEVVDDEQVNVAELLSMFWWPIPSPRAMTKRRARSSMRV